MIFSKRLRSEDHVREFVVDEADERGWQVREEEDHRIVRRAWEHDWHRVEKAMMRFALEASLEPLDVLRGIPARARALELFASLRVWDTEENSGVLIYLQMVDHRIEIVADRGIDRRVEQSAWDAICRRMEVEFRAGRFEAGTIAAIGEVTELLARHFPPGDDNPDELPNRPVVLT